MRKGILIILAVLGIALTANGQDSYVGPFIDSMWRDIIAESNAHFQPAADSTTFFQVKNAAGDVNMVTVNTINGFVSVGNVLPTRHFHIHDAVNSYMHITSDTTRATSNDGMSIGIDSSNSRAVIRVREDMSLSLWTNNTRRLTIFNNGYLGIMELNPETLVELTHATPYQTFHNSTHEDSDGGRESRINFKGEQSGGEETTLAKIEVSHDGAADDEKGQIGIYTNDGSDGDSPTLRMTIDSAGATDVVGAFTAGTVRSDDGVSGTLELDDGSTEKITLVFTGGILTSRTIAATTGSVLADWTD